MQMANPKTLFLIAVNMKGLATAVGVLCFTLVSCGVVDVSIPTAISLADFDDYVRNFFCRA